MLLSSHRAAPSRPAAPRLPTANWAPSTSPCVSCAAEKARSRVEAVVASQLAVVSECSTSGSAAGLEADQTHILDRKAAAALQHQQERQKPVEGSPRPQQQEKQRQQRQQQPAPEPACSTGRQDDAGEDSRSSSAALQHQEKKQKQVETPPEPQQEQQQQRQRHKRKQRQRQKPPPQQQQAPEPACSRGRQEDSDEAWEPSKPSTSGRSVPTVRAAKSVPSLHVTPTSHLGRSAGYIRHNLAAAGKILVTCEVGAGLWQAFKAVRCARTMLLQSENTMPVFQPVQLQQDGNGLAAGTWVLHIHKVLAGPFSTVSLLRVFNEERAKGRAREVASCVRKHGCCVLEALSKEPVLACFKVIHLARSELLGEGIDVCVALDPLVVQYPEGGGSTMHNRFVVMRCAVDRPAQLQIKVSMRLRSPGTASRY